MREPAPGSPEFITRQTMVRARLERYLGTVCEHCGGHYPSLSSVARGIDPPMDKSGLSRFINNPDTYLVWPTLKQLDAYLKARDY